MYHSIQNYIQDIESRYCYVIIFLHKYLPINQKVNALKNQDIGIPHVQVHDIAII